MPQKAKDFAGTDLQRKAIHGNMATKGACQLGRFDDRFARVGSCSFDILVEL